MSAVGEQGANANLMIGKLNGIIDTLAEDHCILDVNGVGYVVFASNKTLSRLPAVGSSASLLIETHVREDHIHLYGFASALEKEWFTVLTKVQGVGVRMGLAILGVFAPDQLMIAITAKDAKALTAVSGVGPKLADRIVTELKGKVDKIGIQSSEFRVQGSGSEQAVENASSSTKPAAKKKKAASADPVPAMDMGMVEDAVSALVNLGYGRTDAHQAVVLQLQESPDAQLDGLITGGLKRLSA